MCTVTFLPIENGYLLTSNRDESTSRPIANPPAEYEIGGHQVIFPKDPQAGGTWIACSKSGVGLCLMNGGLLAHQSHPPYRKSRGLVLLDFFRYQDFNDYVKNYDLQDIEPFSLLVVGLPKTEFISVLRWDGAHLIVEKHPKNKPGIWSSSTLYSLEIRQKREEWFSAWCSNQTHFQQSEIVDFHQFEGKGDSTNGLVMKRGNYLKTLSITSILVSNQIPNMEYIDLEINSRTRIGFSETFLPNFK